MLSQGLIQITPTAPNQASESPGVSGHSIEEMVALDDTVNTGTCKKTSGATLTDLTIPAPAFKMNHHISPTSSAKWCTVGKGPKDLVHLPDVVSGYLGLTSHRAKSALLHGASMSLVYESYDYDGNSGTCVSDKQGPRSFVDTATAIRLTSPAPFSPVECAQGKFITATKLILLNGDRCLPGQHVIVRDVDCLHPGETYVGQVVEILSRVGSENHQKGAPDSILIQRVNVNTHRSPQWYCMPHIERLNVFNAVSLNVSCLQVC